MNALARNCLKKEGNSYFYNDRSIPRRIYQKILEGNWSDLSADKVDKKLEKISKQKRYIESFQILYEVAFASKESQYIFGLAQEKVINDMMKLLKKLKVEARNLVRTNKENHDDTSKS